jgi:hypothetical protein
MVKLSDKSIKDFAKRYHDHFGIELSDSEAKVRATEFLKFFAVISKPILPREENEAVKS